jgi:mevalonate kinase
VNEVVTTITATAPANAVLLGEYAVGDDQPALAVSVGLYATCTMRSVVPDHPAAGGYRIESDGQVALVSFEELMELGQRIDALRAAGDDDALQRQVVQDALIPTKYLLAAPGGDLPATFDVHIEFPPFAGLGTESAIFVALATCLNRLLGRADSPRQIAAWAERAGSVMYDDNVTALATQASLYGGASRYTTAKGAESVPFAAGQVLVLGHTDNGVPLHQVNKQIRARLAEAPAQGPDLQEIRVLSRQGEAALRAGDWPLLGELLNRNQALMERLDVANNALERLIAAALAAGAYGATLAVSASGGLIALGAPERADAIAEAIAQAGGEAIAVPAGVPGVAIEETPGIIGER